MIGWIIASWSHHHHDSRVYSFLLFFTTMLTSAYLGERKIQRRNQEIYQKKFQKTKVATANDDHRLEEMRRSCAQHHAEKTRKQKTRKLLVSCSRRLAVDFDLAARLPNWHNRILLPSHIQDNESKTTTTGAQERGDQRRTAWSICIYRRWLVNRRRIIETSARQHRPCAGARARERANRRNATRKGLG